MSFTYMGRKEPSWPPVEKQMKGKQSLRVGPLKGTQTFGVRSASSRRKDSCAPVLEGRTAAVCFERGEIALCVRRRKKKTMKPVTFLLKGGSGFFKKKEGKTGRGRGEGRVLAERARDIGARREKKSEEGGRAWSRNLARGKGSGERGKKRKRAARLCVASYGTDREKRGRAPARTTLGPSGKEKKKASKKKKAASAVCSAPQTLEGKERKREEGGGPLEHRPHPSGKKPYNGKEKGK